MSSSEKRKRTEAVGVRCTAEQKAKVKAAAAWCGLSVSEFVLRAALRKVDHCVGAGLLIPSEVES